MSKQVFINLPVKDVQASMDFYSKLGFINNPQFSDDNSKCMAWSESVFVMLLDHDKFTNFTNKPLANTKTHIAGLYSLSLESIDQMNSIMATGLAAGGIEPTEMKDYGFMQQRTIEDLDGHSWELFYMDMSKIPNE